MREKVLKLRSKLVRELENIEDGVYIKFDNYDRDLLELIIFDGISNGELINCIDNYGNRNSCKIFALPENIRHRIDYSNISFDNFAVRNFNFSNYFGVKLNPQTVYDKDLSLSTFKGVEFIGAFDGCKINGSNFSGSKGAKIDPLSLQKDKGVVGYGPFSCTGYEKYVAKTINMTDCIFADVTFINSFTSKKIGHFYERFEDKLKILYLIVDIRNSNFSGSKGAKIYPLKIYSGLKGCTLKDAYIIGDISTRRNSKSIVGANFTGAKAKNGLGFDTEIIIDPQTIEGRNLTGATLDGVSFISNFDGAILEDTNFSGSKNAYIDLRKLCDKSNVESVNFSDSIVTNYNGDRALLTEDGRLSTPILEKVNKKLNLSHETPLLSKKEIEYAREKALIDNKNKLRQKITELTDLLKKSEMLGIDTKHLYGTIPIEQDLFLVQIGDHYEINRDIINLSLLRFFNLSLIDFTNVKVSNMDFRHSMARINPQTVYKKDISGCIFDQDNIKFFDNFNGVMMDNTSFDDCDFKPIIKKLV